MFFTFSRWASLWSWLCLPIIKDWMLRVTAEWQNAPKAWGCVKDLCSVPVFCQTKQSRRKLVLNGAGYCILFCSDTKKLRNACWPSFSLQCCCLGKPREEKSQDGLGWAVSFLMGSLCNLLSPVSDWWHVASASAEDGGGAPAAPCMPLTCAHGCGRAVGWDYEEWQWMRPSIRLMGTAKKLTGTSSPVFICPVICAIPSMTCLFFFFFFR